MRRAVVLGVLVVLAACVGSDPTPGGDGTSSSSSGNASSSGGGSSGTTSSGGSSGTSGTPGPCVANEKSCEGNELETCNAAGTGFEPTAETCANGCVAGPPAHCKQIVPSPNGVLPADLAGADLTPMTVTVSATLDTDTGEITGLRGKNLDATKREVIAGVAFHTAVLPGATSKKVGIFSFAKLAIAVQKTITAVGTNALVIASASDVQISGTLDMRGTCLDSAGGPGGGNGGKIGVPPTGDVLGVGKDGITGNGTMNSGGSGGGHGDDGGTASRFATPTQQRFGGQAYGSATIVPLLGGSGGGRGGENQTTAGGAGGGGGGAVQIVAVGKITVGGAPLSGINAGGCGGRGAATGGQAGSGAGGGGGSGGAILLEAPEVKLEPGGFIVVNGGGGGGGTSSTGGGTAGHGSNGAFNQTGASGGGATGTVNSTACGVGGIGGSSNDTTTDPDSTNKGGVGALGGGGACSGGGGGAVGRIRVNTRTGSMIVVDATGKVSAKFDDMNSKGDKASTQGILKEE